MRRICACLVLLLGLASGSSFPSVLYAQKIVAGRVQPAAYQEEDGIPDPNAPPLELLPPPAVAVPPTPGALTLAELEQMALGANPALARAAAQVAAARGNWVQVGLYPNPTIGYSSEEIGDEGGAGQQGGYVSQQFITGGKLSLNRAEASFEVRKAEQALAAQRFRVLTDVRIAYFDILAAQRRIDVTEDLVQAGAEAVETSERLTEVGEASEIDSLQFRVQAEQARLLLNNARNFYDEAWRRLAAVIGAPAMPPTPVLGDVEKPAPEIPWEGALARLLSASPELARAIAETERARWAYQRARVEPIPNPNLQVSVRGDTVSGDTLTSVQFGLPIPLFDRNQGRIREAYAEIVAAEQQVARLELALQEELATVYRRYANALQQVARYRNEILPAAERSLRLTRIGYEGGQVGYLSLLTAQQTYFQAVLSYVSSLQDLWRATMEIDGLLLRGSLRAESGAPD